MPFRDNHFCGIIELSVINGVTRAVSSAMHRRHHFDWAKTVKMTAAKRKKEVSHIFFLGEQKLSLVIINSAQEPGRQVRHCPASEGLW